MPLLFGCPIKIRPTKLIAYHEAGHAVVAVRFDLSFSYVTIKPDGAIAGRVQQRRGRNHRAILAKGMTSQRKRRAEHELLMLLAGAEAQRRYRPSSNAAHGFQDMLQATSVAASLLGSKGDIDMSNSCLRRYMGEMRARSATVVCECWPQIVAVAEAIYAQQVLKCDDVKRICEATARPTGFAGDRSNRISVFSSGAVPV